MIHGTTPTHIFKLPFSVTNIKKSKVIYAQGGNIVLTKDGTQCQCVENTISVTLTQEETFLFDLKNPVEIQLRILTVDEKAMASKIKLVGVEKCLESEVLQ